MDWGEFEQRAGRVIPDQPLKAKRCWIGVLLHDKNPRQEFNELDFIWMIGHSVSLFCYAYLQSNPEIQGSY